MKSIYLDIGNSFLKMAYFHDGEWEIAFDGELDRLNELCKKIEEMDDVEEILISSVRKDVWERLVENLPDLELRPFKTEDIPARMLDYKTPETLGLDRFLVCLAALRESGKNVVVIDSGSACTVDLMTGDGVYRGGVIIPGLQLWKKAMEQRLPELPSAPEEIPAVWPGKSTIECIGWGVNGAYKEVLRSFIHHYRSTLEEEMDVYITGGESGRIIKWLGDEEHLLHRKYLIWDGLLEFELLLQKEESS